MTLPLQEEAPATEEDTIAHLGKRLFINDNTNFWGFLYRSPPPPLHLLTNPNTFGHPPETPTLPSPLLTPKHLYGDVVIKNYAYGQQSSLAYVYYTRSKMVNRAKFTVKTKVKTAFKITVKITVKFIVKLRSK